MTDKQDPITHAARLLREAAEELRQAHAYNNSEGWENETDAKAAYDEHLAAAQALEDWEQAIGAGGVSGPLIGRAALSANAGEPVAWQYRSLRDNGAWFDCTKERFEMRCTQPEIWETRALYAAPPTAQAEGWISVDERLPEPDGPVLAYPPLPRVGAIGYASRVDIESYAKTLTIGPHLPGVRDIALWTTDQMRAYVDADRAARAQADSVPAQVLVAALIAAKQAINSMKAEAETAAQGDEQMMLEACETISNENLQADIAIRAALASAQQPAPSAAVLDYPHARRFGGCPACGRSDCVAMSCTRTTSDDLLHIAARKQGGKHDNH